MTAKLIGLEKVKPANPIIMNDFIYDSICIVLVSDGNETRQVDIGDYYKKDGQLCLITTKRLALKYSHLVDKKIPIYTFKDDKL